MRDDDARQFLEAVERLIRPRLERSEPLRRAVESVARMLLDLAASADAASRPEERQEAVRPGNPAPSDDPGIVPAPSHGGGAGPSPMPAATVPLRLGDAVSEVRVPGTTEDILRARQSAQQAEGEAAPPERPPEPPAAVDLGLIERRSRLKAESCRLFIERRRVAGDREHEPAILEQMNQMIAQAKALPGCFLWVFWRERQPPDDGDLETIAACYDALAEAAALVSRLEDDGGASDRHAEEEAFQLLAEASSALRRALERTWLTAPDTDQDEAHHWLRLETAVRRIYVPRHMTLEDPADPANAPDLRARISEARQRYEERVRHRKAVAEAIRQVAYHARQVAGKVADDAAHDWRKIDGAAARLAELGVPPTDRRLVEALGPAVGIEPVGVEPGRALAAALRAAREDAERRTGEPDEPAAPEREWTERVRQVRALLAGRDVVVIGGERRREAIERLMEAFALRECEWVELSEHGSGAPMAAPIQRPGTALVLVIIRLTGHLHADEAREFAKRAGKPCVLLPGGYNPEQVAEAVLEQASNQLRREAASTAPGAAASGR